MPDAIEAGQVHVTDVWKRFRRFDEETASRAPLLVRRANRGEWWWALREIDLHLEPGEGVGVVGRNGSGKSTLMKIIAGYLYPYSGEVRVGGRIGAIVEMTTGTHGELTGRENVVLLGSLVGRTRRDMTAQMDEIIEFSGLADAIDRPFKFYSSGMKTRLGFSVIALTEPDVLIVDEALSVGDVEFRQISEARIRELRRAGVTLLYVSHDLGSVRLLCPRTALISNSRITVDGPTEEVLVGYEATFEPDTSLVAGPTLDIGSITGTSERQVDSGLAEVEVEVDLRSHEQQDLVVHVGIARAGSLVLQSTHVVTLPEGRSKLRCDFEPMPLVTGSYFVWAGIERPDGSPLLRWTRAGRVEVTGRDAEPFPWTQPRLAPLRVGAEWYEVPPQPGTT